MTVWKGDPSVQRDEVKPGFSRIGYGGCGTGEKRPMNVTERKFYFIRFVVTKSTPELGGRAVFFSRGALAFGIVM